MSERDGVDVNRLFSDGRPAWEDTCECVCVCCEVKDQRPHESDEQFAERWESHIRNHYEKGANWNYDADCPKCFGGEILFANNP